MTRSHAAIKLLEHGPLTVSEFHAITGWTYRACQHVIATLRRAGSVRMVKRGFYEVAR